MKYLVNIFVHDIRAIILYLYEEKKFSPCFVVVCGCSNVSKFNLQKAFKRKNISTHEKHSAHEIHSKLSLQKPSTRAKIQPMQNIQHTTNVQAIKIVKGFNMSK